MAYTWDVVPKSFVDEVGEEKTIVGIQCNIVSMVEFNRNEYKERELYIAFVTDNGSLHNPRYISSMSFVKKMVLEGVPEEIAQFQVKSILKGLDYGNLAEIEQNAAVLASMYGYQLVSNEEGN